jgi:hypothetical protein
MPTLHGSMPYDRGPERPCVWCRKPTDITFRPEFAPSLGPQPLHMMCAVSLIRAYERWKAGHALDGYSLDRLKALAG